MACPNDVLGVLRSQNPRVARELLSIHGHVKRFECNDIHGPHFRDAQQSALHSGSVVTRQGDGRIGNEPFGQREPLGRNGSGARANASEATDRVSFVTSCERDDMHFVAQLAKKANRIEHHDLAAVVGREGDPWRRDEDPQARARIASV